MCVVTVFRSYLIKTLVKSVLEVVCTLHELNRLLLGVIRVNRLLSDICKLYFVADVLTIQKPHFEN